MRVLSAAAAVILMLLGAAAPRQGSAQDELGHILLSVRVCVGDRVNVYVEGTFADVPCDLLAGGGNDTSLVISLDGGAFGDGTSTLTLPFGSILHANLYLTPGDSTLTMTSEQRTDPLVSSIDLHIIAGETLPLTYTVTYGLRWGSEPPPTPGDAVPEVPVDHPATPVAATEVPAPDTAVPMDLFPTDVGEVPDTDTSDALPVTTEVTTLPSTGTGSVTSSSAFTRVSLVLAAFGVIAAVAVRLRRT